MAAGSEGGRVPSSLIWKGSFFQGALDDGGMPRKGTGQHGGSTALRPQSVPGHTGRTAKDIRMSSKHVLRGGQHSARLVADAVRLGASLLFLDSAKQDIGQVAGKTWTIDLQGTSVSGSVDVDYERWAKKGVRGLIRRRTRSSRGYESRVLEGALFYSRGRLEDYRVRASGCAGG